MDHVTLPQTTSPAYLNLAPTVSVDTIAALYNASQNPNTVATRVSHLRMLEKYCAGLGWGWGVHTAVAFEEGWLVSHLVELYNSGASFSTIDGRVDAIHTWSRMNHLPSPVTGFVKELRNGMGNTSAKENQRGKRVRKEAPALSRQQLHRIVDTIDVSTLVGKRDRALLLMGWHGAYRRSELATLSVENVIPWCREGLRGVLCSVYNTKTNKDTAVKKQIEAQPTEKYCPVRAYEVWLSASRVTEGPVFRAVDRWGKVSESLSDRAVDKIVRKYAKGFSAHSLRAGYATQSVEDGIPEVYARKQGGWAGTSPIFARYATRAEVGKVLRVRPV